ncbi:RraA-like protein [Penicillium malachiteum]|uniref:RraA-like protein n=1 Tax=Penicillium malachiteum TaxID=1324776 RepID=UPI0025489109|nr:RraA-like protein [Penicillium malachiteum]KAJ5735304.1 RraA-like protein [Penicillium malachiteum]
MSSSVDGIVKELRKFTTCDICDALIKINSSRVKHGGFLPGLTMWSPQRQEGETKIVGPAYTVKYVPLDDPRPKFPSHYIDSIPEGAVIFVSSPQTPNAVYGGLMSTRAIVNMAAGAVIGGRFRDLEEQRMQNFPVFARDIGTAPPYETVKIVAVNEPVKFQVDGREEIVEPGDYLMADLHGVVVLPASLAQQALPLMEKQAKVDSQVSAAMKVGMPFEEACEEFRG